MPSDPDYAIYAEQLFSLNHGHALFEPDSASQGYDQIRVGDVGYIRFGAFRRLFNICFDRDHPINEKIPEDFVPLAEEHRKIWTRHPLEAGIWSSSTVRELGGGLGLSEPIAINAGAAIKLLCVGQRGAALTIKDCAARCDAESMLAFQRCMKEQYESWHAFARNVLCRDVKVRDIVLVTGCDLAADWVTMTFDKMELGAKVSFEIGQFPIGSGEFTLWGKWGASTTIPQRWGPKRSSAIRQSKLPEVSSDQLFGLPDSRNQCIFIRGYRVFHRAWFLPRLIAAAEPKDLDGGLPPPPSASSGSLSEPTTPEKYTIEESGQETQSQSPADTLRQDLYDILAEFVFQTSAVDMVLIHDDNVCTAASAASDGGLCFSIALLSSLFDVERAECSSGSANVGVLRNKPSSNSPSRYLSPVIAASDSPDATKFSLGPRLENDHTRRSFEILNLQAQNSALKVHNEELLRENKELLREIEQLRRESHERSPPFLDFDHPFLEREIAVSDNRRGYGLISSGQVITPGSNTASPEDPSDTCSPPPEPHIILEEAMQSILDRIKPAAFPHPTGMPGVFPSGIYDSRNRSSEEQKGAGPSARK